MGDYIARPFVVVLLVVGLLGFTISSCKESGKAAQSRPTLVVKEPADLAEDSAVYRCDADGVPHYAFLRKQEGKLLFIHDGKQIGVFDSTYDKSPTLSSDGKRVAYWGIRGDKVVLVEDAHELATLAKNEVGETDVFCTTDGAFVFRYQLRTGESIQRDGYVHYLFHTFVLSGKQRLGPFGRAFVWCPDTGNGFLLFATKSRGAPRKQLEQDVTEWVVFRNGTEIKRWSTEEPLAVPIGTYNTASSDGNHYLVALRLSKQKWELVLDGRSVATFDGAMVGDPYLCVESKGSNRIVTDTLSLAKDGSHWLCGAIVGGQFQILLDGKPVKSLTGWCPISAPLVASDGRLGPFLAVNAIEKPNDGGMVDAYSEEWTYKWGAYTCKKSLVVGDVPQESPYGDMKYLVVSDDGKHYAYAALEGELSGVTLSRSGWSQNFQGTWHIVNDGKEGPPWADVRRICFAQGKSRVVALVRRAEDKTSAMKDAFSVLLDTTPVASYELAWGLSPKKATLVWFSQSGTDVFINRLVTQ